MEWEPGLEEERAQTGEKRDEGGCGEGKQTEHSRGCYPLLIRLAGGAISGELCPFQHCPLSQLNTDWRRRIEIM